MDWKTEQIPDRLSDVLVELKTSYTHDTLKYDIIHWHDFDKEHPILYPAGYYDDWCEGPLGMGQIEKWCEIK